MDSQGGFKFVIGQFGVALLLILREQHVGTLRSRCGGDQDRISVVVGVAPGGPLVVSKLETVYRPFASTLRRRQLVAIGLAQGNHFVTEIGGRLSLAEEFARAACDRRRIGVASTVGDALGDLLQTLAKFLDRLLAILLGHLLVGGAEDKDCTARDRIARVAFGQFVPDDRQFVMLFGQTALRTSALLLDREVAGLFPLEFRPIFVEQRAEIVPGDGGDRVVSRLVKPQQVAPPKTCPGRKSPSTPAA